MVADRPRWYQRVQYLRDDVKQYIFACTGATVAAVDWIELQRDTGGWFHSPQFMANSGVVSGIYSNMSGI